MIVVSCRSQKAGSSSSLLCRTNTAVYGYFLLSFHHRSSKMAKLTTQDEARRIVQFVVKPPFSCLPVRGRPPGPLFTENNTKRVACAYRAAQRCSSPLGRHQVNHTTYITDTLVRGKRANNVRSLISHQCLGSSQSFRSLTYPPIHPPTKACRYPSITERKSPDSSAKPGAKRKKEEKLVF